VPLDPAGPTGHSDWSAMRAFCARLQELTGPDHVIHTALEQLEFDGEAPTIARYLYVYALGAAAKGVLGSIRRGRGTVADPAALADWTYLNLDLMSAWRRSRAISASSGLGRPIVAPAGLPSSRPASRSRRR